MDKPLFAFGIGTFHALVVFVVLLLLLHLGNGLQGLLALGAASGIAVFLGFTGLTIAYTAGALRGVARGRHPFGQAMLWGAGEGVTAQLVFALSVTISGEPQILLFTVFTLPFAAGVGAVVGFVLALLDMVLIDAGALLRPESPPEVPSPMP